MKYVIDAWLERPDPYIHIVDADTGNIQLTFETTAVRRLLERGDISARELCEQQPQCINSLLQQLFLCSCSKNVNRICDCGINLIEWRNGMGLTIQ